jgi:NADPH:quinone reductase-like Zn-dependent oxidoreductase
VRLELACREWAVVEQVERGEVAPNVDAVYALEQTIDAHRRMAANEATGKLVVLPRAATARAAAS